MTTRWKAGASLRILKGLGDFVIVLAGWGRRLNWSNESERIFFCAMIVFVAAAFYDYRGVGGGCVPFWEIWGVGRGCGAMVLISVDFFLETAALGGGWDVRRRRSGCGRTRFTEVGRVGMIEVHAQSGQSRSRSR